MPEPPEVPIVDCCICGEQYEATDPGAEYRSLDGKWWCADDHACMDRASRIAAIQAQIVSTSRALILTEMEIALASVWDELEKEGWQWPGQPA